MEDIDPTLMIPHEAFKVVLHEESEWRCYLFGGGETGIIWYPQKDKVPNWFWRWMQYICLGNRWVKDE